MISIMHLWLALGLLCLSCVRVAWASTVTPFLQQSFFFDWNKPGQPYPVPVTQQCETIHIVWSRGSATGPDPIPPYYLQVYTSTSNTPVVIPVGNVLQFDWAVPFAPGTLYQICMFDKFGNTGGCQDSYTMIPSTTSTTPSCANVTFPPQLTVSAIVSNGPMSQYGWVDQCSDISLIPSGGTGPYTLTVAPSLHPPYNITAPGDKPINWTVSLDWASQFYISLADSAGHMWSNGPLHAGGGGSIECLSGNPIKDTKTKVSLPVTIGSGIGGLVLGLLVGAVSGYFLLKRRAKKKEDADRFINLPSGPTTPGLMYETGAMNQGYTVVPTMSTAGMLTMSSPSSPSRPISNYQVEPFMMPDENGFNRGSHYNQSSYNTHNTHETMPLRLSPPPATAPAPLPPPPQPAPPAPIVPVPHAGPSRNVYVVHHDSQAPPVTIYHEEGTQVVELPPRYPPSSFAAEGAIEAGPSQGLTHSDSRSDGSWTRSGASQREREAAAAELQVHQARQPNRAAKPPR